MSQRKIKPKATAQSNDRKKDTDKKSSPGLLSWLVVISIVLPVIYSSTTLDPVVSIRYLLYCAFVTLFFLYLYFFKRKTVSFPSSKFTTIIFITGLSYCLYSILSMATAINSHESWMEVSRNVMNLFFLAIVLIVVYYDGNKLAGLCKVFTVLGTVHSIIGILQYCDIGFTELPGNFVPYGLMANRNLYASAQVLILPFCAYSLLSGSRPWKYITVTSMALIFMSILLSQTRAAWLSTGLILIGSLLLVLLFVPSYRKIWLVGTGACIGFIALLVTLFVFTGSDQLKQSLRERTSVLAKPVSVSDTVSTAAKTANERLVIWDKTWQLIKDHKSVGVGPANWKIGVQAYGNQGLINEYGDYVLDHAHNIFLQLAAENGIPALILFLAFWLLIFIAGFRCLKRASISDNQKILIILCLCGIAAFALDGLFSFPLERIEHSFYLLLMTGIVLGLYMRNLAQEKLRMIPIKPWFWAPIAISAFIFFISKQKYNFEIHAYRVKAYNKTNDYQDVVNEVEESKTPYASLNINGDPLQMFSAIAYKQLKQYDQGLQECNAALRYHPYNARIYNTLGTIYTEMQNFPKAVEAYQKSLAITPKADVTLKNLAVNYYNVKQYQQCLDILSQIKDVEKEPILVQIKNACIDQLKNRK